MVSREQAAVGAPAVRESAQEYARFLSIAYASAREAQYEIDLATRLGYIKSAMVDDLNRRAADVARLLKRPLGPVKSIAT